MIAGTALFQHLREYRAIAFHGLDEFDQKTSSEAERHLDGQDSGFAPVTMSFFEAHFADIERPRPHDRRPMMYGLIRSEKRRVGKEWDSKCSIRLCEYHEQK